MHDLVIRGGTLVDGTGAPARAADVAVDDGRITEVGDVEADARSYFNTNFDAGPHLASISADDLDIEVSEVGDELVLSATAVMPTRFMRLFGQDTVTVAATTRINREIRQMELALVLDNTGSMWGTLSSELSPTRESI